MIEPRQSFTGMVRRWWAYVVSGVAAVTAIRQFVEMWRGDTETTTLIIAIWSNLFLLAWLAFVAFKKQTSAITVDAAPAYRVPACIPYHKKARYALAAVTLLSVIAWASFLTRGCDRRGRVTVLIANFSGPDQEKYRVTEKVLAQMRQSLGAYRDTRVLPLNRTAPEGVSISEQQGSETAVAMGRRNCADLVLWGWYAVTATDVLVTIHIETLTPYAWLPISNSEIYSAQATVSGLQSFRFQQSLSEEMSAFALFLTGLVRLQAKDYPEAILRLGDALASNKWPEGLISKGALNLNRGITYLMANNPEAAVQDASQAIRVNPNSAEAYNVRGAANFKLQHYREAIDDYTRALDRNPSDATFYHNRSLAFLFAEDYNDASQDASNAIELGLGKEAARLAYEIRGMARQQIGNDADAVVDLSEALRGTVGTGDLYYRRAISYSRLAEHSAAIDDFSNAIRMQPRHSFYYDLRADEWNRVGERWKAVADFTQAIAINPEDPLAVAGRGITFSGAGRYADALADLRSGLQILSDPEFRLENLTHTPVNSDQASIRKVVGGLVAATQDLKAASKNLRRCRQALGLSEEDLRRLEGSARQNP
jgi:tetratricopeptide (TPR) repeat protein